MAISMKISHSLRSDHSRLCYMHLDEAMRNCLKAWADRFPNNLDDADPAAQELEADLRERIYLDALGRLGDAFNALSEAQAADGNVPELVKI